MLLKSGKIVAFIPVRGGSKSIPLKNIKLFCDKPLVYWSAKAASESPFIDVVYVATDSAKIAFAVEDMHLDKVIVINREAVTATDTATTESAMLDFARLYDFQHIALIQATNPLLDEMDLSAGIKKYLDGKYDSLLSVVRQKRFIWQETISGAIPMNYRPENRPRRQEFEGYLVENGAFYVTSRDRLLNTGSRLSGIIGAYEMAGDTYFEIDEPDDWVVMEQLKRQRLGSDKKDININLFITDVDGVLTDAGMYYDTLGGELKKFNTRDGKGIELLQMNGIKTMFLTSEETEIVKRRAKKLQIDYCFTGIKDKAAFLERFFCDHPEYSYETSAYIGDDVNDVAVLKKVRFSAAPMDAVPNAKAAAQYVCRLGGGQGCMRELADIILQNLINS